MAVIIDKKKAASGLRLELKKDTYGVWYLVPISMRCCEMEFKDKVVYKERVEVSCPCGDWAWKHAPIPGARFYLSETKDQTKALSRWVSWWFTGKDETEVKIEWA